MKKKQSVRDMREQAKNGRIADIRKREAEQKAELERAAEAERIRKVQEAEAERLRREQAKFEALRKEIGESGKPPKSGAKAAGLKSTFVLNENELIMTSFGNGSAAILEKHIVGEAIEPLTDTPTLTVEPAKEDFSIVGRTNRRAAEGNPLWESPQAKAPKRPGQDLIDSREFLEMRYFGQNFEDNIHIQAAYAILDIDKILAIHINNVVYELDNMFRKGEGDFDDFLGYMGKKHTYEVFMNPEANFRKDEEKILRNAQEMKALFTELMRQPQLGYFGDILLLPKLTRKNQAEVEAKQRKGYYLLGVLGALRQAMAHDPEKQVALYSLKKVENAFQPEALTVLHKLYSERVEALNRDFLEHAKKDLVILYRMHGITAPEEKAEIVRSYYDFIVRKTFKNCGFSIKKLRETLLERFIPEAKAEMYDSVRAKLNHMLDFTIFEHYRKNAERAAMMVEKLRASDNDTDKTVLYVLEAEALNKALGDFVREHILPEMDGSSIKRIDADQATNKEMLRDVLVPGQATVFSEMMYLLTCFLDGKEINDLLTTLINKFDNIAAFVDTMRELGLPCTFTGRFSLFNESHKVAEELRVINSFARMSAPSPEAKKSMYREAGEILGFDDTTKDSDALLDAILDKKSGKKLPNGKRDFSFRNFIANNVIESDRFKYMVRYCNAKNIRTLANNANVLSFVLKDIPDAQVLRYYNSCCGTHYEALTEAMRPKLCEMMTGLKFNQFENVYTGNNGTAQQQMDKERKKALVRLYLTVLYLLTKNLVYVNSRYFLAFHCVERDSAIHGMPVAKENFGAFAESFIETHGKNRRAKNYILQNIANSDPNMVREFRNCVMHLNAVRNAQQYIDEIGPFNSYFELYHYLMQRMLESQYLWRKGKGELPNGINPIMLGYMERVKRHHGYCKDMVKALNVPFAYNLPRYKNLSIDALFDRNRPPMKGDDLGMEPQADE